MSGCRRTSMLSTFRLSLSLPVTKAILPLSYGSQGLSGGRWASQWKLRSSEDSRRRARRGGGRLAAMRATDRHIGAAQVLRRPRPAVQWLQVWASGIRAPRRAQHGRAACAAAKLGPPVKDDGQRYARAKNISRPHKIWRRRPWVEANRTTGKQPAVWPGATSPRRRLTRRRGCRRLAASGCFV